MALMGKAAWIVHWLTRKVTCTCVIEVMEALLNCSGYMAQANINMRIVLRAPFSPTKVEKNRPGAARGVSAQLSEPCITIAPWKNARSVLPRQDVDGMVRCRQDI